MLKASYLLFSVGLIGLALSYGLFTTAQYFSLPSMALLLALSLASIAALTLSYPARTLNEGWKGLSREIKLLIAFIVLASLAETLFVIANSANNVYTLYDSLSNSFGTVIIAIVLSALATVAAYAISSEASKLEDKSQAYAIIAGVIIAAAVIGGIQYALLSSYSSVRGTDELALGFFAARAFLNGTNPYAVSFAGNLHASGIAGTLFLNSTCQCGYGYPALSFILMAPFAAVAKTYQGFVPLALVITSALVILSFVFVFRTHGKDRYLLAPIFAIALLTYSVGQWALIKYLLMLALLFAYAYRKKPFVYAIFLGCAISLHQLGWMLMPFFALLTLKEDGWKTALNAIGGATAVFLLFNAYFIYATGTSILTRFIGASTWLIPRGLSITQLLLAFYPVRFGYSMPLFWILYAALLAAFYLYGRSRALIYTAIPLVFMLSTSSSVTYVIPGAILLLYMLAENHKGTDNADATMPKKASLTYLAMGSAGFLLLLAIMTIHSHMVFSVTRPVFLMNASGAVTMINGTVYVNTFIAHVCNAMNHDANVSMYISTERPYGHLEIAHTSMVYEPAGACRSYVASGLDRLGLTPESKIAVWITADKYVSPIVKMSFSGAI